MTKSSVSQIVVSQPMDELPERGRGAGGKSSELWESIRGECEYNPGKWIAFGIPGRNRKTLQSSVQGIKNGKIVAFRGGEWDAAVRGEKLYVRYLGAQSEVAPLKAVS